uniref:Uncharacterized protein n=1 Tax=Timema cristinae TaxID=61476 RepID=A0A7R9CLL8_TIMCR|nr:unnamed protein product [Timema cristinae]
MTTHKSIKDIIPALPDERIDMLAATSVLQHQATEIRTQRVNWQSYLQSQMISQEDYSFIVSFDNADSATRESLLKDNRNQCAKTFLNLLGHVSKDQTIQYILIMIDDMLQEDRSRVEIFREHAAKKRESVWGPFLNLLNRPDGFIMNMTSKIIAKIACWSQELMDRSDLHFYLTWLKDQLKQNVSLGGLHIPPHISCSRMTLVLPSFQSVTPPNPVKSPLMVALLSSPIVPSWSIVNHRLTKPAVAYTGVTGLPLIGPQTRLYNGSKTLTAAKKKDILDLLPYIPPINHDFFDNLRIDTAVEDLRLLSDEDKDGDSIA